MRTCYIYTEGSNNALQTKGSAATRTYAGVEEMVLPMHMKERDKSTLRGMVQEKAHGLTQASLSVHVQGSCCG